MMFCFFFYFFWNFARLIFFEILLKFCRNFWKFNGNPLNLQLSMNFRDVREKTRQETRQETQRRPVCPPPTWRWGFGSRKRTLPWRGGREKFIKNSHKKMQNSTKKLKKIGNSIIQSRKNVDDFWLKFWDWRTVQRSALCRSRRELSNEYLLAKIGVDTAENEPLEVWGKIFNIIHWCP